MAELPIHITTHHLTLNDALRRYARDKIAPVIRFANDALGAEVVLRRHHGAVSRFSASARLALPGKDIHGRAVHHDLLGAQPRRLAGEPSQNARDRLVALSRTAGQQPSALRTRRLSLRG